MAFFSEQELEESAQRAQNQTSSEYLYLENISKVRQDRAARTLGLSRGTGINPELIYDNPSLQVQNLISPKDFEQLGFTNPQVKQFLEDPIHMGIVRDKSNIKVLQEVDDNFKIWTATKNGFKLIGSNAANFLAGTYQNAEHEKFDEFNTLSFAPASFIDWKGIAQSPNLQRQDVKADTIVGQYLLDIVEQAPQFAAQITAAAIGGIPATVGFMGTQIAGGTYGELVNDGVDTERAYNAGLANALFQAPLESLPIYKLFKPSAPLFNIGGPRASRLLEAALTESITEFVQQYPEEAVNLWAKTEGLSWQDRAKMFVANIGNTTTNALYAGAVAAPFGFVGGAGRVYFDRSLANQVHKESLNVLEKDAEAIRKSELLKLSPEVIERFTNSQGETVYVDAEATLKLYQSGKNNLLKDLNIAEEELVEAATKGEMLEIPKGTYEVAVAKDQTIHESLKEDIAFNNDGLTTNKINYLNDKDVKKSTQAVIEERKALTKEQNNIYREMRKTGIQSDVARSAITALKGHAQVMADYEGITASQWLKDNAPRFKKDLSNIVYTQNQPISPAAQKRIDEITEYLNTKIDIKIAGNGNGQYFYINNKGNLLLTKDKEKANRYSKNLEKKIASKYPNLNVVVEETKRARDISNDERYKLESEKEALISGFNSVREYNAYLEKIAEEREQRRLEQEKLEIENSGQVVVNLNGEFVKRIKALDEKDYGINKNLSYRENAGNAELDSRDAYNAMSEFVEERLSLIDDILSENGYEVQRDDSRVSLSKYLTVTSKTHEDTYYKIRISDHTDHYGGNDLLLFTQDTMQESIEKLANFLARKEGTDFYYQQGKEADIENLVAIHNIRPEGLLHADKLGGLPVPSIAIGNVDMSPSGFGEITLIGDKELIDPADRRNKVFNTDIYSPRYPSIEYEINANELDKYFAESKNLERFVNIDGDSIPGLATIVYDLENARRRINENNWIKLLYADNQQLDKNINKIELNAYIEENEDDYKDFVDDFLKQVVKKEKIFKGYTNIGNKRYAAHTLENIVKEMSKKVQAAEDFAPSIGLLRATVAKRYKNILQIQKDRKNILNKEEFNKIKELTQNEYIEISKEAEAKNEWEYSSDFWETVLQGIKSKNIQKALNEQGYIDVDINRINTFLDTLKNMPTEYFEAKIQRAVELREFAGAVIPSDASKKVRQILDNSNIKYAEYSKEDNNRAEVVKKFVTELNSISRKNILFQENRGAITWDNEGRAIIGFFQNADPSTVVHELAGHYFTENLRRIATRENAPEQAKKDWQTLLNDAKLKDWETASQEEKIAAQERWAELAENYFLQGKAPSIELKSVFAKFKRWIRQVYSSIKQANIQVPEEVAKVFDRLLASQQAIDELTVVEGYYNKLPVDLVESLSKAGQKDLERKLTKAREKAEDLTEKTLMNYIKADTQQAIKEERVKATQTFTQELSQQPLYQAIEILTNDFKKYYKTAKNTANAYQVKSETLFNGKGYKGRFREDMEVHFDYLAALNGFTSGSELAQKIIDSPTLQQAVQEKVDQHIQLTFPDYMQNPSQLRQEARENIYNDDSALLIATEQTVIQEQLTNALNLDERRQLARYIEIQAQIAAQEEIARLPIKQATNLQKYIAAERSAAVKADRALRAKDYTNAQLYKAQQLYNHNMVRESLSVRRRNEQITKYLKRQAKSKIKGWNKEVNFVQAADILQKINIPHSKYNPQLKLETLESYWNRNMLENPDITNIPDVALYGLHEGIRTNDLTISEYEDVANAIKNIRQLDKIGVDSNSFFTIDNGGSISERTEKLLDSASKLKDVLIDEAGAPRAQGKFLKGLQEYYLGNKKITQILLELDNLQDFGVWHDTFYRGVKEASDYKSTLIRDVSEKINEAFTTEGIDFKQRYRDTNNKVFIKEWNVNLSKQDLRTLILNMGSESNLKVLLGKTPVGFDQSEQWRQNNWTEKQIKQVAMQYLDEKDLRIVDKVWHAINSLYEPYNQMVTKMTGFSLAKVEARPIEFTLFDGKVFRSQGGYFPLKQDRRATKQAELNAEKALGDYVGVIPYTNTGASKARTGATYAIDLDFNNIFRHIDQVTQDTAFRPIMHDLNKIMRKDEIRDVLRHKLGEEGYTVIKDWQQAVSAGKETLTGNGGMDTIVNLIRSRTVTANLLLRPGVILQNNANFLLYGNSVQGFTEKDAISSYFKRGLGDYIPNAIGNTKRAKALREFVYNKSVMMRDKMDAPDFSLREYQSMVREGNILTRTSTGTAQEIGLKIELTREKINQIGTNLMAWSDQLTDIPMWLGAYEKALDLGKSEQDAAHFADTVIERSTGSGRLIDTSRLQRGGQWQRTMTMFTGFFNTQLNRWIREKQIFMDTGDIGRMFVFALKQYLGFGVVSALLSFKLPDEDDPWEWFIKDIVAWPLGMVPFWGPAIKGQLETMLGFQSYGFTLSPVTSQLDTFGRAGKKILNEETTTAEKAETLATSGAFLFGYPDQLNDWFFNLYDIVINEMEPDLMDLAKRRPRKER